MEEVLNIIDINGKLYLTGNLPPSQAKEHLIWWDKEGNALVETEEPGRIPLPEEAYLLLQKKCFIDDNGHPMEYILYEVSSMNMELKVITTLARNSDPEKVRTLMNVPPLVKKYILCQILNLDNCAFLGDLFYVYDENYYGDP